MKANWLLTPSLIAMLSLPAAWGQQLDVESVAGRETAAHEILIKLKPGVDIQLLSQALDIESAQTVGNTGVIRLRSRSLDAAALVDRVTRNPYIAWSEPNYVIRTSSAPDDLRFPEQWSLQNTAQTVSGQVGLPFADIEAVKAWDINTGSANVLVGLLDTGVDYTHQDLAANIWSAPAPFTLTFGSKSITCPAGSHGFNGLAFSCDPRDDHTHGTHVAGVIGARGNNTLGISGVSQVASIVSLKFLNAFGLGSVADAALTIDAAIQMKLQGINIRVLNVGWGSAATSTLLQTAIANAAANDILIVAGAGNNKQDNDGASPFYPASDAGPNIIAVAATDNQDKLAKFSNFGLTSVDLGAPGVDILSTVPADGYESFSGTSLATAHVTGTAALILSQCPALTYAQVKNAILNSVDAVPSLVGKTATGGRLNAYRALTYCGGSAGFALSAAPLAVNVTAGTTTSSQLTVTPLNGYTGNVTLSVSGLPPDVGTLFTTNPVPIPGSGTSLLMFTAAANAVKGVYPITVTATDGLITHTQGLSLTVNVPDFGLSANPVSLSINPGGGAGTKVSVAALFGFTGTVNLSASGLPAGVSPSFQPASIIASGDSTLVLTATPAVVPGTYTFLVQGQSGALIHSITLNLLVNTPDFNLSAAPGTVTVVPGASAGSVITMTPLNGFSDSVTLAASGMPAGVVASLSPNPLTNGGGSNLTFTAALGAIPGTYAITVTGTSGALLRTTTVNLTVQGPLTVTTVSLATGQVGVPYEQKLTGTGGVLPYKWSVISGRLPRGFSLDPATGIISGTPIGPFNAPFTFQLTDSSTPNPKTTTASFFLTVTDATFAITTPSLPDAQIGVPYSKTLTTIGGTGPYTWSIVAGGALPDGLALNAATGEISGIPTTLANNAYIFQVTDSNVPAQVATRLLNLTVTQPSLVVTTTSLPNAKVGAPYSQFLTASGGSLPYTWKIISGRLPAGLTFNEATGLISGIPLAQSSGASIIFRVTDSTAPFPQSATANLLLVVKP